jgi:hypothetical protein
MRAAWLQVSTLPSYKTVADVLEPLKAQGRTIGYWQTDLVAGFAFPIIYKYVTSGFPTATFNEDEFAKLYDEVESYLSGTDVGVRVFLDLTALVTELSPIVLDESRRILQIDSDTVKRLLSRAYRTDVPITAGSHFFTTLTGWKMPHAQPGQAVLELTFRYPKEKFSELSVKQRNERSHHRVAPQLARHRFCATAGLRAHRIRS